MCRSAAFALWIALLAGYLAAPSAWASGARAILDRSAIAMDETVSLMIEIDERAAGVNPNLEPLERDFQILGSSSSAHVEMSNGRAAIKTQWIVQLEPKRSGEIRIPALQVGSKRTSPLALKVKGQSVADDERALEAVFLEASAQPETSYVQSQIRFTLRLFYAAPILEGSIAAPEPNDAVVERLGEDITYETTRNGKRYSVIERRYAIFPQKSGTLTIPPISFRGRILDSTYAGGHSFLDRGRFTQATAGAMAIEVLPRPAHYSADQWLPSEALTLRESWPEGALQFRVGEPVIRTLILEAKGLNATQLPELQLPEIPQVRVYSDQALTNTHQDSSGVFAQREQRMAIVPTQLGQFTLPEIRLPWWDTQRNEQRVAILPERTITVVPAANSQQPAQLPTQQPSASANSPMNRETPPAAANFWYWLSVILLSVWLLTLAIWWRERRLRTAAIGIIQEPPTASAARRALRRACLSNDAPAAAKALLEWAEATWPKLPPRNLGALAARLAGSSEPLRGLDRALYAPAAQWQGGAELWEVFKTGMANKQPVAPRRAELPPLYPSRADLSN